MGWSSWRLCQTLLADSLNIYIKQIVFASSKTITNKTNVISVIFSPSLNYTGTFQHHITYFCVEVFCLSVCTCTCMLACVQEVMCGHMTLPEHNPLDTDVWANTTARVQSASALTLTPIPSSPSSLRIGPVCLLMKACRLRLDILICWFPSSSHSKSGGAGGGGGR